MKSTVDKIKMFLENNLTAEANKELNQALKNNPNHFDLLLLKAHILSKFYYFLNEESLEYKRGVGIIYMPIEEFGKNIKYDVLEFLVGELKQQVEEDINISGEEKIKRINLLALTLFYAICAEIDYLENKENLASDKFSFHDTDANYRKWRDVQIELSARHYFSALKIYKNVLPILEPYKEDSLILNNILCIKSRICDFLVSYCNTEWANFREESMNLHEILKWDIRQIDSSFVCDESYMILPFAYNKYKYNEESKRTFAKIKYWAERDLRWIKAHNLDESMYSTYYNNQLEKYQEEKDEKNAVAKTESSLKSNTEPEKKKSNVFLSVIKAIGKGFYYVGASIVYIIGVLFSFKFITDLFDNKKK